MLNIFSCSAEFVKKHKKHHHLVLGLMALVLAGAGTYTYRNDIAQAATYTFSQASWAGGLDASTPLATHTSNQSWWTKYSASSSVVADVNGVRLPSATTKAFEDGAGLGALSPASIASSAATPGGTAVSPNGASVYVTGVSGIATFSRNITTGALTLVNNISIGNANRSPVVSPDNAYVYFVGANSNLIYQYSRNASTGALTALSPASLATQTGPMDMVISPDGTNAYVANSSSNTVSMYSRNAATGLLTAIGTPIAAGSATYGIGISPDGTSVYTTNFSANNISQFSRDTTTGLLAALGTPTIAAGSGTAHITVSPDGANVYAVNQTGGTISQYTRNTSTGALTVLGSALSTGGQPWKIVVSPDGGAVYVPSGTANSILPFTRNTSTGLLTAQSVPTITTNTAPRSIAISPDGGFVYAANYTSNTVSMFKRTTTSGFEAGANSGTVVAGTGSSASVGILGAGFSATGGATSTSGSYTVHTFTGSGTFQVTAGATNVDYLVVGGGGSGVRTNASYSGGGGGGGGVLTGTSSVSLGSYAITVGAGGAARVSLASGNTGGNSTFNGLTAVGGGGGGYATAGKVGGSGGGGSGGLAGGAGTAGQGYAGGASGTANTNAGGGGGAGAVGGAGAGTVNGNGGNGITSSISGVSTYYGGGGGGGGKSGVTNGTGGLGGGTAGAVGVASATSTPNTGGGTGASDIAAGQGGSGIVIVRYLTPTGSASGTFTSAVINMTAKQAFTTLAYTSTLNGQTLTIDVRAGNTATPDGTWSAWTTNIASGGDISALSGNQYVQYRANLSTTNSAVTPTLDSLTINATQFTSPGTLTSTVYDTVDATNLISKIAWNATGTTTDEIIKFQVRSSSDNSTWSNWCGYADSGSTCTGTNYFLDAHNGVSMSSSHPLRSNANDRYLQYKMYISSSGDLTPTLTGVTVTYVVNAPPSFDATYGTNGIVVSQVSDSASADYGKVSISYSIRDTDTSTGTTNPGYATPSFEYNAGAGWVSLTSNLAVGDTSNKTVDNTNYNTYTATWNAPAAGTFNTASAQVRVTVNDNEAANNTASATSGNFTLDTTIPTAYASLDSSTGGVSAGTITLTASDTNTLQYRLCNDNAFPSSDTQGNSCAWSGPSTNLASTTIPWVPTGAPSTERVYLQVRDLYGNVATSPTSVLAPAMPTSLLAADTSNPTANAYGESLSWVAPANAVSYRVYYATTASASTVPSSYTLLASPTTNVYTHTITTATSSAHWYRVKALNANGDISELTTEQTTGDVPDSFGTTLPDTTAPTIVSSSVPTIRNSSANIIFDTNELAVSQIYYGTSSCSTATTLSTTYATSNSVWLTGLTPLQTYTYCFRATDTLGNQSNIITGSTFTTVGGPVISNVTEREITDTSALIFWNTTASSTSYVKYATTAAGVSAGTQVGSATLVAESPTAGVYQHQVGLTGLTSGVTYYYQVTSADSLGNSTVDTNSGQYYHFVTLRDTSPPVISGIATPVLSSSAAVVVWETDEPSTSQILYSGTLGDHSNFTTEDTTKSIYHVQTLSSATLNAKAGATDVALSNNALSASTPYYYVVKSTDVAGNSTTSSENTLTTAESGAATITVVAVSITAPSTAGATPDTTAPIVSGTEVSDITPFGATVKFSTSEDTVGIVKYGKDSLYGDNASDDTWGTTHTINLRGLRLGTENHILAKAIDKAGNTGVGTDKTFTTKFLSEGLTANVDNIEQYQKEIEAAIESVLPSLVPPFVSKPQIADITENSASVTFKTNIKAFPVLVYAEDGAYDEKKENPYTGEVSDTTEKTVTHELNLTGLKGNTKYHIQARAFSLPKVIGKSADLTFVTKASKIAGSIVERKKDSFTVVWTTDVPTSSIVEFKNLKSGVTERKVEDALRTSHSMKIENLPSGTTYDVNISGVNEKGNTAEAGSALSVTTSRDVTAPEISGFKVDNALVPGRTDRIQTIVSWTTDEPANSTVFYEEGAGTAGDTKELANKSEALDSYTTAHSVILPNLKPGIIYRLKVTSSDDSGNEAVFGPRTVITPRQTESITDIIFKNFEDSFKFLRKI